MTAHDGKAIETMQVEERRCKPSPDISQHANAQPDICDISLDGLNRGVKKRLLVRALE